MNETNFNTHSDANQPRKLTEKTKTLLRLKRRLLKHIWIARLLGIASIVFSFLVVIFVLGKVFGNLGLSSYGKFLTSFILANDSQLKSANNRTNIVILGKAGKDHAGGDLTDSIILVSVGDGSIKLISLPRDIWVPEIRAKLNSAYYWGNQRQEKGGLVLSKSLVEQIVGVPVHYAAVFDFSSFKDLVDILGGVKVDVAREFVDKKYPVAGRENDECGGDSEFLCRYETIHFAQGKQTMDGETALKFVRSRNAEGDEGSDIAREARQQKVIAGIKEKLLSPETIFNPKRILSIIKLAQTSIETDMQVASLGSLARKITGARKNVATLILPEKFLKNPPISPRYDNQYVFIPADGNWETLQSWVKDILK